MPRIKFPGSFFSSFFFSTVGTVIGSIISHFRAKLYDITFEVPVFSRFSDCFSIADFFLSLSLSLSSFIQPRRRVFRDYSFFSFFFNSFHFWYNPFLSMFHIPYVRVISTPPTLYTEDLVTRTDTRSSPSSWRRKKLEEGRRRRREGTIVQRR